MYIILATEATFTDWVPVIIQVVVGVTAVFGGAGFWQYKQTKYQAQIDKESKENGTEKKVGELIDTVKNLDVKVDNLTTDVKSLRSDIELLQSANEETVRYRELRDKADKEALRVQLAVIESLKGMMRERLLEVYKSCMKKGYYTMEERETYGELFKCYESEPFDGNGVMHDLQPIIKALPMTPEEAGKK